MNPAPQPAPLDTDWETRGVPRVSNAHWWLAVSLYGGFTLFLFYLAVRRWQMLQ